MIPVGAGDLRHRVTIRKRVAKPPTDPNYGATVTPDGGYKDHVTVWAKIEPQQIREWSVGGTVAIANTVSYRVTIRYRTDIDSSDQLLFQGRVFEINGKLDPDERHLFLVLSCSEGM